MTYPEWMAARQLLAEERLGVLIRQAEAQEDAASARARVNIARVDRGTGRDG
jgi:hypothetical protein